MGLLTLVTMTLVILISFWIRDPLHRFHDWFAPVYPWADTRLKRRIRRVYIDVSLAVCTAVVLFSVVVASDFVGRLWGRLI